MGSLLTRSLLDASVLVEPYGLSGLYKQSNNGIMNLKRRIESYNNRIITCFKKVAIPLKKLNSNRKTLTKITKIVPNV